MFCVVGETCMYQKCVENVALVPIPIFCGILLSTTVDWPFNTIQFTWTFSLQYYFLPRTMLV